MDFQGISRQALLANAHKLLARLAVTASVGTPKHGSLLDRFPARDSDSPTLSLADFNVVVALCDALDPVPQALAHAAPVVDRLVGVLLRLPSTQFSRAVLQRLPSTPPWLLLAKKVTASLATVATSRAELAPKVAAAFARFAELLFAPKQPSLPVYWAMLGFLEALTAAPEIFAQSERGFDIFGQLDSNIDNPQFHMDLEAYTATLPTVALAQRYHEHPSVHLLSPVLFILALGSLMASITRAVFGWSSSKISLMEFLLEKVSQEEHNGRFPTSKTPVAAQANPAQNGHANGHSAPYPNGSSLVLDDDEPEPYLPNGTDRLSSVASSLDSLRISDSALSLRLNELQLNFIRVLAHTASRKLALLDQGESYIVYLTLERLKIGYSAKSELLLVVLAGSMSNVVDLDVAKSIFYSSIAIPDIMLDPVLGSAVFQLGSLLVYKDSSLGSSLTRCFTSLVANPSFAFDECQLASSALGLASRALPQDTVITTIYALTNLLFVGSDIQMIRLRKNTGMRSRQASDLVQRNETRSHSDRPSLRVVSSPSQRETFDDNTYLDICRNAVTAICEIVAACGDESVSALAVTILSQKTINMNMALAPYILDGLVSCAPYLPEKEFVMLVKHLHKMAMDAYDSNKSDLYEAILVARCKLSNTLRAPHPLYNVYMSEILQAIIGHGDVQVLDHHRSHSEISAIGVRIASYLKPLADLLPDFRIEEPPLVIEDGHILFLFRNIWFNMVVHGFSINSTYAQTHAKELERIAYSTPPLASELSWNRTETSLELNTVLKRGSSNHNVKDHKHIVGDIFEVPRAISYSKLMFLASAIFVESLRVRSGDCHTILMYYSDPSLKTSGIDKHLAPITHKINKDYTKLINCGADRQFSAQNVAQQLTSMLILCCNGLEDLQDAALHCSDMLISKVPSSLCHHTSLFALFDLLTLLYDSVIDSELHQYNPQFVFTAEKTKIQLRMPDSYSWRYATFKRFHEKAKTWLKFLLLRCNLDTKSLIQAYISEGDRFQSNKTIKFGISFALDMAGSIGPADRELFQLPDVGKLPTFNLLPPVVSQLTWRSSFISDVRDRVSFATPESSHKAMQDLRSQVEAFVKRVEYEDEHIPLQEITDLLSEIAGYALCQDSYLAELVRYLVDIPFMVFESSSMRAATSIWGAVMKERPSLSTSVIAEILKNWEYSIHLKQGIFSRRQDLVAPAFGKMEYSPSDFEHVSKVAAGVNKSFQPHAEIVKLMSSNFEATMNQSDHLLKMFTRLATVGLQHIITGSLHPFARFIRFELVKFAFDVLHYHVELGSRSCRRITELILDSCLSWFKSNSNYPFGSNLLKIKADYALLREVAGLIELTHTYKSETLSLKKTLLLFFMDDEISKIAVWLHSNDPVDSTGTFIKGSISGEHLTRAYSLDPELALNLAHRYKVKNLDEHLKKLISSNPIPAMPYADAVQYFIGVNAGTNMPSHHLLFWEVLSPIDAITLFLPPFGNNPYILQFTMRSLEHHDVNLTFFYVPQIVQSLRYDAKGYVSRFIIETARVSSLFAHQIVWNMLANSYKDEEATVPDSLKPSLDKIQKLMLANFSKKDLAFYEREFGFFSEVTSISGKLKPYIKKSKAEKKLKIDEEMSKIELEPGVYLPSNPDGVLIDINRKSGKPLQSHAKAPFMATFKIRKEVEDVDDYGRVIKVPIEKWQSAIFKVGDDCRQDVLALQLISVFRTIWLNTGLDLYVFPYRVTATAPGCGVIDVLPNSTSRDMLGREAVNGLYEYYITRFGPEISIEFQQARNNLIRSLAAYSIISYLLQFKDRHNGNIMYDEQGHILHIDFGFCFDIVPGGVKFEVAPFKLTKEMVMVLGGSDRTQAYKWFEELCVKGFLACRPYMETIVRCVNPMLESGLPCFKDTTIKKLRKRFVPTKTEKDAAHHFKGLIRKSYESFYTTGYDEFQRLTNGIPY